MADVCDHHVVTSVGLVRWRLPSQNFGLIRSL